MRLKTVAIAASVALGVAGDTIRAEARAQAQQAPPAAQTSLVTSRYDETFQKYAKRFFGPGFDWRLFKAQSMAESNLDPNARSWVGARGLMQLMPRTQREVLSKNPDLKALPRPPELNIAAGIAYDRQLWLLWTADTDESHMREFMLGSYNAGRGTLLRAQDLAEQQALDHRVWPSIKVVAPKVPRWRSDETLTYLDRIFANLLRMDRNGQIHK
jgi:soluble lytic murein transglycosylase-like protein